MTYLELQNELITQPGARFKPTQRDSVKQWLNARYAQVWGSEDWTFRKASGSVTVTAGNATAAAPANYGIGMGLWTELGDLVTYVTPKDYLDTHTGTVVSGTPDSYTVLNGVVLLDPTPAASATYTCLYEKAFVPLALDADVPLLPAEHHYMLVYGALSQGSVMMQDFTYQFAEQEWQNEIAAMKRNYLANTRGEPVQWGRG